jgi:hypothetical protein
MKVALEKIVLDSAIYPRKAVNEFHVARIAAALAAGNAMPLLIVEAKKLRLVDGWHRYEAYKRRKTKAVEVEERVYSNEADLFADSVRLNTKHGEPLDRYCIRNAIIRLEEYGYTHAHISEVTRLPVDQIAKMERGFASDARTGKPVALKGGLQHLGGHALNKDQIAINRRYSGGKAVFYARQLTELLRHEMWPQSTEFVRAIDALVDAWLKIKGKETA